ncbi:MAG: DNA internalization-related competence protein ComEC/Rec2 [Gammaproteobacteria bacterium]|nr:DNA internalization-related competence protein ComEC/Rec2 [Gammaproteobacteria bacterium]
MRRMALGFLIGTAGLQPLSVLPGRAFLLGLLVTLLMAVTALAWFFRGRPWPVFMNLVIGTGMGFFMASIIAHSLLAGALPTELEGQDVVVEGYIASLPEWQGRRLRFQFVPHSLHWQGEIQAVPGKLLLSWYSRKEHKIPSVHVGERWRLQVRLKRPHGFSNPGGFDYEAWLFQQGIRAKGYVRHATKHPAVDATVSLNQRLTPAGNAYRVGQLRETLRTRILAALDDHPLRGIVLALAIGDRQQISQPQWDVLMRTGTNHLVAISGLHVGLVAGFAFFLMHRLWRCSAHAVIHWPAAKAGAVAALLAAAVYAMLAGFSVPTQRALVMVAVVMLAIIVQRHTRPSHLLALALLLVLMIDPLAVMAAGFWLSFGAVAVIVYGMSGRLAMNSYWWRWGRVQWLVAVGLFPALLLLFQQASVVAPLANLLAVPWVSLVTVPLTLLGSICLGFSTTLGGWLLGLSTLSLDALWWWLDGLAQWKLAAWQQMAPPLWAMPVAVMGILWLLAPRGVPARWVGLVGLLPLLFVSPAVIPQGQARFTLLDVGQGLAAVVQTQNHVLVFDTGPQFSSGFNTGEAVVAPYLRAQGRRHIDTLVVSHGDNDHIGGVAGLRATISVQQVLSSVPQRIDGAELCQAGQRWQWDGVIFTMLSPGKHVHVGGRESNNRSCVLRVQAGEHSVLLTGDIERAAEDELVRVFGNKLASDVLVAPHHGSRTSSTPAFLAAVSPTVALFPVGYRNRYGFPKAHIVQRYRDQQVRLFDTARHGAIELQLGSKDGLDAVNTHRQQAARYWHVKDKPDAKLPHLLIHPADKTFQQNLPAK